MSKNGISLTIFLLGTTLVVVSGLDLPVLSRGVSEQGICPDIGVVGVPVGTCPGVSSGQGPSTKSVYLSDANYCHVYHECSNGVPVCMYCPNYITVSGAFARLHWDKIEETCNYPYNAKCSLNPVTPTPAPTTTTKPTPPACTCPRLSKNYTPIPSAICKVEGLNADPTDCAVYYQCESYSANGWIMYTERCDNGLVFNPTTSLCDYPENVSGCEAYYQ